MNRDALKIAEMTAEIWRLKYLKIEGENKLLREAVIACRDYAVGKATDLDLVETCELASKALGEKP